MVVRELKIGGMTRVDKGPVLIRSLRARCDSLWVAQQLAAHQSPSMHQMTAIACDNTSRVAIVSN